MSKASKSQSFGSVLVVGGCGFLGHHIVSLLADQYDAQISVLDLRTVRNRRDGVSYYDGDITSEARAKEVFEQVKPDVVIHTASPPLMEHKKDLMYTVNVEGTKNLVQVAGAIGSVKAFVYTSSASVIHDTVNDLVNADERWPYVVGKDQLEYYSETKAEAEKLVLEANRQYNKMLTASIRPAGIIGEGDVQILPNILKAYRKGQTGFQLGDNDNLFDFTYVGNVAHAHVLAAIALLNTYARSTAPLDHERVDGEAFFVTNDSPVYFWDFPRMVWKAAGDKTGTNVWTIPKDTGLKIATILEWLFWFVGKTPNLTRKQVRYSCMTRYYNIDKAKRRLGYKPLVSLEEGVQKSVKWFLEQEQQVNEKKDQ
ncbi:MAG: hypothetical protein M1819_004951 [Sarea resinae]|nr:MAG: hypothetical protein M1819_004951 [Sarea resinae]